MTPYEYLRRYRNLTVRLVNGGTLSGIDVHEYRNAQDVFDKRNTDKDPTNNVDNMAADFDAGPGWYKAWPPLRAALAKHGKKVGNGLYELRFPLPTKDNPKPIVTSTQTVSAPELASAFFGKGKPETIAEVLRLAEAFGLVRGTAAAMQTYCDEYIGLDCNGYVGNFLREEGSTIVGPSTPAHAYAFLPEGRRVSKLEDITNRSVLCWKNAGHVAIIDLSYGRISVPPKFDTEIIRCMVCESTGARAIAGDIHTDGLNYTMYEIHPPKAGKVFLVKRGLGGGKLNEVYIGNLL